MDAIITQDVAPFRGIEQVYVIPFQTASAGPVVAESTRLGNGNVNIHNPTLGQSDLIANNYHLYEFASVPLKTNRVLAYGKAPDSGNVSTKEGKRKNGVLTPSKLTDPNTLPGGISFSLEPIIETGDTDELTAINTTSYNLIAKLNDLVEVLQASDDAEIRALLDVFTFKDQISACSYQTLYSLQLPILNALQSVEDANPETINAVMTKLSALQAARNAAGKDFPASYGIPEGTIGMWWNGYRFVKTIPDVNISLVPANLYCYPPSLWYYANSQVKTSNDDSVNQEYNKPQANPTWGDILTHYGETSVTAATRSVAIVDQMQYGVGVVEFRFLPLEGNAVSAANCPLTGIIIGDQMDVDYRFAPKSSKSLFVYDNTISGITLGGTSQYIQVLVLPTAPDQIVHFALEFQNKTSSTFQCQQGTVPLDAKFYLAGKLMPYSPDSGITKPEDEDIVSVFNSDHKTTVYIKVNDLNKAYNVVPDLRDPQLELGVVAEVDWMQVEPGGIKLPF